MSRHLAGRARSPFQLRFSGSINFMNFNRRDFLKTTGAAVLATAALPVWAQRVGQHGIMKKEPTTNPMLGVPDSVSVLTEMGERTLHARDNRWTESDIELLIEPQPDVGLRVVLSAPMQRVKRLHLRWQASLDPTWKYLGDAWERAYGDLAWRPLPGSRPMPWYFLASDGHRTNGFGVMTGAAAMCYWKADAGGISLFADVRSAGVGVKLGNRQLAVCTVVGRRGTGDETPFQAARAFCKQMCPKPRLPKQPVYGFNDWYCAYGRNTAERFLVDAAFISSLAPKGANRPFCVVDAGWQVNAGDSGCDAGPWNRTNAQFGSSLAELAEQIRTLNAKPGVWYRPLIASPDHPKNWRLQSRQECLDPTVSEVREQVAADLRRFHTWGYELVKHDFSTFDISGRFGNVMEDNFTGDGWSFASCSRTTAEVIRDLYLGLRQAAGDDMEIIGCNTVSHLAAGVFELQRVGDDVSGKEWNRTRKMGVNSLAFRAPQHQTFYAADADCAALTAAGAVPWEKDRQWLDLLARSGTPLFVSWPKSLVGPEQERAIRDAFAIASVPQPPGEPLDWMENPTPAKWKLMGDEKTYVWF